MARSQEARRQTVRDAAGVLRSLVRRPMDEIGPSFAVLAIEMPVSALVLTIDESFDASHRIQLEDDPRITVGEARGAFLPIVTETDHVVEARNLVEELLELRGVADAQLVSWADDEAVDELCGGESNHGA